jgi:hypothetical protein
MLSHAFRRVIHRFYRGQSSNCEDELIRSVGNQVGSTGTNGMRRHLVGKGERPRRLTRRSSADQFRSNNFSVVKTDQPRSAQQLRGLNQKVVELSS